MKILMVCMGNICRSPMAEGIMKHLLHKKGKEVFVDSAGTIHHHIGEAPDMRATSKAMQHGIDISVLRARQFNESDFDNFDCIYVMDKNNFIEVAKKARDNEDIEKVELIMNTILPGSDTEVPDPYYGGEEGFENVYQMLWKACSKIADSI